MARKTELDKAIDVLDRDIAGLRDQIKVLELAKARLEQQQRERRGHPEGGKGI